MYNNERIGKGYLKVTTDYQNGKSTPILRYFQTVIITILQILHAVVTIICDIGNTYQIIFGYKKSNWVIFPNYMCIQMLESGMPLDIF